MTRDEKAVLRMIQGKRVCPDCYDRSLFNRCADSLERKGLVRCAWGEGHILIDARISDFGLVYMGDNPSLRNPIDWK